MIRDQGPITESNVAYFDDLLYIPPDEMLISNISFPNDRIRNILTGEGAMLKARGVNGVCHIPPDLFHMRFSISIYRMTSSADDHATRSTQGYIVLQGQHGHNVDRQDS